MYVQQVYRCERKVLKSIGTLTVPTVSFVWSFGLCIFTAKVFFSLKFYIGELMLQVGVLFYT